MNKQINSEKVYRAEFSTFSNRVFDIAVLAYCEDDARTDMLTAIKEFSNMPFGMIRVKNLRKSNRRFLKGLSPIKSCCVVRNNKKYFWAFVR